MVVASGDFDEEDASWLDDADLLVAADGGAAALARHDRCPELLVGDLDSIEPALVERLATAGTRVERHPSSKDASDTELAIAAAVSAGATEIILLGAAGGDRLDHELANLLLLADPALVALDVRAVHGATTIRVLHGGGVAGLVGSAGDRVTLLPIGGDASGVTTHGLRWRLDGASLRMGRSRGLSNEVLAAPASVRLERGTLFVFETSMRGASE
ncbi:MAG TPA: thiamine diphosphokinase [Methylomirabilota bacterium]|nr:thiamine diphosphokinase [Methylomirabilota bacterium]